MARRLLAGNGIRCAAFALVVRHALLKACRGINGLGDLMLQTIVAEVQHIGTIREPTGLVLTVHEVHLLARSRIGCKTVVVLQHVAAYGAAHRTIRIVNSRMTVSTRVSLLLGAGVDNRAIQVVHVDFKLRLRHVNAQIDSTVILRHLREVEIRVIRSRIALLARRTADVVDGTVLVVHLAAGQGHGASIRVIMAREHEVDARLVDNDRKLRMNLGIATNHVGVVGGLMHGQDFPLSLARLSVLFQPLQRRIELRGVARVVDGCDIHVAVRDRVIAARSRHREVIHLARAHSIGIARILVVAQHVQHIGIAELVRAEQVDDALPVGVADGIVNSVASLNAEIVALRLDLVHQVIDVRQVIGLDVANQEERNVLFVRQRLELLLVRPRAVKADAVTIRCARLEALKHHVVHDSGGIAISGERARGGAGFDRHPISSLAIGNARILQDLFRRALRAAQPADALLRSGIGSRMVHNTVRRTSFITLSIEAGHGDAERQTTILLGEHNVATGLVAEAIGFEQAVLVRGAKRFLGVAVDILDVNALGRVAFSIDDLHGALRANDNGISAHDVCSSHRIGSFRRRERQERAIRSGKAARLHLVLERHGIGKRGGHRNADGRNNVIISGALRGNRLALSIDDQCARQLLVLVHSLERIAERDRVIGKLVVNLQRHARSIDLRDIRSLHLQVHRTAQDGCRLLRHHRNGRNVGNALAFHGEVLRDRCFVAELVAQGNRHGMLAIGKGHVVQVALGAIRIGHELEFVVAVRVHAVDVQADRAHVNAARVLVLNVAQHSIERHVIRVEHGAIFQCGAVCGHGVHHGGINVVDVSAVDELQVVEVDGTSGARAHLRAVNEHEAERHAGLDAQRS